MEKEKLYEHPFNGFFVSGFIMLSIYAVLIAAAVLVGVFFYETPELCAPVIVGLVLAMILMLSGFFTQQPNQVRVMIFFGNYRGTFSGTGFYWVNPFMSRKKISLRIRNMDVEPIKVNDKEGNPVMIGMVLVWKVKDPYRVVFDVNTQSDTAVQQQNGEIVEVKNFDRSLNAFVRIQADAALREVTGHYAYDDTDNTTNELTLRGGGDEINERLEQKINERLEMAGIHVVEARLNYLAYAPEIAAVMLRRQQATAIIAAREKIVEGAVSMVKMALNQLSEENVVELDEERKAAMVSNMLVVLCADEPAQPVLNTGSLYQ